MGGFRALSEGRTNRIKRNGLEVGNEREVPWMASSFLVWNYQSEVDCGRNRFGHVKFQMSGFIKRVAFRDD